MFQNTKKRGARRGWPIHGYVGPNGGGKTAAMVWDTLPSLRMGRPVLSTVRLLDWEKPRVCEGCNDPGHERPVFGLPLEVGPLVEEFGGMDLIPAHELAAFLEGLGCEWDDLERPIIGHTTHLAAHPLWQPLTDYEQLLEARGCDVLLDEVTGIASSRESMSMPAPVVNKLVQLRRADVVVRWSAPSWPRADKVIRECSQAVTYCQGHLPKRAKGGEDRLWRQRRLFRWKTYDADAFEDFTAGKREQLGAMIRDWHWGPGSPVFAAYDTFDSVLSITTVTESGTCYRCGGHRRRPSCKCGDNHELEVPADSAGPRRGARRPVPGPVGTDLESGMRDETSIDTGSDHVRVPAGGNAAPSVR